jgi:hypothetical protein
MKLSGKVILPFASVLFFLLSFTLFSSAALAQTVSLGTIAGGIAGGPKAQVGSPYSLERETETVRTLVDGTHIVTKTHSLMYRDSQGRMRTENFTPDRLQTGNSSQEPTMINIEDPVEGVQYVLTPHNHTATRIVIRRIDPPPPPPKPPVNAPPNTLPPPPPRRSELKVSTQTEDLGTQMIEGVWAKGTRRTMTIPANSQGNDRPIVTVAETWFSDDLRLEVLTKRSDPRTGETTERLTNIDRSEPDPALFRPPADYTIKEPQRQ